MAAIKPNPLYLGKSLSGVPDFCVNFSVAGKQIALIKDTNYVLNLMDTGIFTVKPEKCIIGYIGGANVLVSPSIITGFPSTQDFEDCVKSVNPPALMLAGESITELNFYADSNISLILGFYSRL